MESNEVLDRLPLHLKDIIIDQPYNEYTAQDHAVWRYVMRRNVKYLSRVAHGSYVEGLKRTGISIDEIPHMYGMNRILKEIGWAAVAVDGFIPPSAFMEFQAYNVLVIAADIRSIDQIEYTPAPDIIHEAAGHAPIIADEEYAAYLRRFGEIGHKAFSSARDYDIYEAIRHLSILKADPYTKASETEKAEKELEELERSAGALSEMALIRNLHWWTVEYGLIGDLKKPLIYGAGLLSSIGESFSALQDSVKKLPYTIDAMNVGFDITTRQPQLYVTPDFEHLTTVLEEFADKMAYRKGGVEGVLKAIESNNTATCVYSSGLQVSGTFTEVIINREKPVYIKTEGPTTLNYKNKQLKGHGRDYHSHGFSSPAGMLKGIGTAPEKLTDNELLELGLEAGKKTELEFESGVKVSGILKHTEKSEGNILLMSFTGCKVTFRDRVLFRPEWGIYDMAVGAEIISAYSGPADPDAFGLKYPVPKEKTHKIIHSETNKKLHNIYQRIRRMRENQVRDEEMLPLWNELRVSFPYDWLSAIELYELVKSSGINHGLQDEIYRHLDNLQRQKSEIADLIRNGLDLVT